jgi:glycosyltransferase involved in cell wall biosynthesis
LEERILSDELAVCVCTFNSSLTISACLESVRKSAGNCRIIVVDHFSTDGTLELASRYNVEIHKESVGLGYARQICFGLVSEEFLAFVDSDVVIADHKFFENAIRILTSERSQVGAVVGLALGHRFRYGLPASLLVLRTDDFRGIAIPSEIDARETYFIQSRLNQLGLKVRYIPDSIIHRSQYRKFKPEWEGANTRLLPSPKLKELGFAFKVILLLSLNSGDMKNVVYIPIFYLKFLRGFVNPRPWLRLERRGG